MVFRLTVPSHCLNQYWFIVISLLLHSFKTNIASAQCINHKKGLRNRLCKITSASLSCLWVNSLAPGRSTCDFINVIFNHALLIGISKSPYDTILRWMPQDLTDDKWTLVQVMAWCRQATSHYLNQCWPRSPTPYGVTRPQWVKPRTSYMLPLPMEVALKISDYHQHESVESFPTKTCFFVYYSCVT